MRMLINRGKSIFWWFSLISIQSENAKKIAQKKLDISTEDVASRMKNFIDVNRKRIQELLTLINVLREYQFQVSVTVNQ